MDNGTKSLKSYGVKTGDLISVHVSKPEAMSAAAAANDRARKAAGSKRERRERNNQLEETSGQQITIILLVLLLKFHGNSPSQPSLLR